MHYLLSFMLSRTNDPTGLSQSRLKDAYCKNVPEFLTAKPVLANMILQQFLVFHKNILEQNELSTHSPGAQLRARDELALLQQQLSNLKLLFAGDQEALAMAESVEQAIQKSE